MKRTIMIFARIGNRVAVRVLPRRVHFRLERAMKAALAEYISSGRSFVEGEDAHAAIVDPIARPVSKKVLVRKNDIASPLTHFLTCSGREIDAGPSFVKQLKQDAAQKCDLVLCCAFQGRHQVLERAVDESLAANEGANVRWMLIGSTEEDQKLIHALAGKTKRVAGCIVENRPLGRKWQTAMKLASIHFDAELYGITGSDDIVSKRLVDHIIHRHRKNLLTDIDPRFLPSLYATLEWLVVHNNPRAHLVPQVLKCNYDYETAFQPLGAGRFYTRAHINEFDGFIFDSDMERLLDDRGYFQVRDKERPMEYFTMEDGPLISVKGDWAQMNSVSAFLDAKTLKLREFSFEGHKLMRDSLSPTTHRYLFKPSVLAPQFNFSTTPVGLHS